MNDSTHVTEELSAYLDGETDAKATARIETHLRECAACAQRHQELDSVALQVRRLRGPEARPEFVTRVLARVREESVPTASWWERLLAALPAPRGRMLAAAGFACAVGVLGIAVYNAAQPLQVSVPVQAPMAAVQGDAYAAAELLDELITGGMDSEVLAEYAEAEDSAPLDDSGVMDPATEEVIDMEFLAMLDAGWEQADDDGYATFDDLSAEEQMAVQHLLQGGYQDSVEY